MPKKVISVCLYGTDPLYHRWAFSFLMRARRHYPGWTLRCYVDRGTVPRKVVDQLMLGGAEIVPRVAERGGTEPMLWRFLVADDPRADIYIIRDIDNLLGKRDRWAVDEWLAGDKGFHVIRDHPLHQARILGGLWGGRKRIAGIAGMVEEFTKKAPPPLMKGSDQKFLCRRIYPKIRSDLCVHSSYVRYFFERALPSPPYDPDEPHMGRRRRHRNPSMASSVERHLIAHRRKPHAKQQASITHLYMPSVIGTRLPRLVQRCIVMALRIIDYLYIRARL